MPIETIVFIIFIMYITFYFPIWNIYSFIYYIKKKKEKKDTKYIESIGIFISSIVYYLYVSFEGVTGADWNTRIYPDQFHSFIYTKSALTVMIIAIVTLIGYIVIRFIPIEEQTPVASIFGISSIYLGVFFLFVLIIQTKQLGLLCLV